jgi:hypothetical protein
MKETPTIYPLSTTYKAIEAACRLNLQLIHDNHGADTVEAFNKLIEDFCRVFSKFSTRMSVQEAVDLWRYEHDEYGKLVLND